MKNKNKLYINLSGLPLFSLHPILKNVYEKLSKENSVIYINEGKKIGKKKDIPRNNRFKGIKIVSYKIKKIANRLFPRIFLVLKRYDAPIMTANNFLIGPNNYYIITSGLAQFSGLKSQPLYNFIFKIFFKKFIKSDKLKNIFVYSQTAKEEFERYFKDKLKLNKDEYKKVTNKLVLYYPELIDNNSVSEEYIINRIKKSEKINFLFIARSFLGKGGKELIEALNKIHSQKEILIDKFSIDIITDIDDKYNQKIQKLISYGFDINLYGIDFTQEEIEERFYKKSHVLLHLTRADIFGMVSLESKKNGLAIITTKQYLNYPELFNEKEALFVEIKDGYLRDNELPILNYHDTWNQSKNILNIDDIYNNIIKCLDKNLLEDLSLKNMKSLDRFINITNINDLL